jgi:hypothetical protein
VNVGSFLEFLHPNALLHPQPSLDLEVSLALEYGGFQIGQDGCQQVFVFGPLDTEDFTVTPDVEALEPIRVLLNAALLKL